MLMRFGRWALGLYLPPRPADLRLVDVRPVAEGLTQIVAAVDIGDRHRDRLAAYQQEQHASRDQLQESIMAREVAEQGHHEPA